MQVFVGGASLWKTLNPHLACRSLDFPIDCPVCKLNSPNADSEDAEEASAGPATDQHDKIRTTDRTHSEHFMLHVNDVDPHHAMQLHASHSTPSLKTIMLSDQAQQKMARSSRQTAACHGANPSISSQHADDTERADKFGGSELEHLGPGIDICAKTAQVGFINGDSMTNDESYQSRSHVHSPSFPVIVTGTPITPSFIPPEPLAPQGSSSLFSAHQPTQRSDSLTHSTEATQSSTLRVTGSDLSGSTDDKKEEEGRHRMAGRHVAYAELAGGHLPSAEQMSQRSASLGTSFEHSTACCRFPCLQAHTCHTPVMPGGRNHNSESKCKAAAASATSQKAPAAALPQFEFEQHGNHCGRL